MDSRARGARCKFESRLGRQGGFARGLGRRGLDCERRRKLGRSICPLRDWREGGGWRGLGVVRVG